jgi:hypothetical protein
VLADKNDKMILEMDGWMDGSICDTKYQTIENGDGLLHTFSLERERMLL